MPCIKVRAVTDDENVPCVNDVHLPVMVYDNLSRAEVLSTRTQLECDNTSPEDRCEPMNIDPEGSQTVYCCLEQYLSGCVIEVVDVFFDEHGLADLAAKMAAHIVDKNDFLCFRKWIEA